MPTAAGRVLKRICGFTSITTNKIPISMEVISEKGTRSRFLITTEVLPAHNVKAEGLSTNYKHVAKEMDVFRDAQMQADIKDMLDANDGK